MKIPHFLPLQKVGKLERGTSYMQIKNNTNITPNTTIPQNVDSLLSDAIKVFTSRDISLTKEDMASIKSFLTNVKGTLEQQMDTLRIMGTEANCDFR